jgi:hypothetical protein
MHSRFMLIATADSQGFIAVTSMKRAGKPSDIENQPRGIQRCQQTPRQVFGLESRGGLVLAGQNKWPSNHGAPCCRKHLFSRRSSRCLGRCGLNHRSAPNESRSSNGGWPALN